MSTVDVNLTLDEWSGTVEKLLTAIADKNFKKFRRAYSDGCRYFRIISRYIKENDITDELKSKILAVSECWSKTAQPLSLWKDEVGKELNSIKKGNKVRNKLTRAYAFKPSQTGNNIRRNPR